MKEIKGNIFDLMLEDGVDSICITTNGIVGNDGKALMGAGTAGAAASKWPAVRANLGHCLKDRPNYPYVIGMLDKENNFQNTSLKIIKEKDFKCLIWSFPTKDDFRFKSIPKLIEQSASLMVKNADKLDLKKVLIPLPGCGRGTGKLSWTKDVKPLLEPILDDRFWITYFEGEI